MTSWGTQNVSTKDVELSNDGPDDHCEKHCLGSRSICQKLGELAGVPPYIFEESHTISSITEKNLYREMMMVRYVGNNTRSEIE